MSWIKNILKTTDKNSIDFLIEKVNNGDKEAQFDLALKYANGEGIEKNILKAIELYEPLAQNDDLISAHNVALLYCSNYGDNTEELKRGIQYFKYASNNGYSPSSCELMKLHLVGFGVEKSHKIAIGYLLRAIEDGSVKCKDEYYRAIIGLKEFGTSLENRILIVEEEAEYVRIEYELLHNILGERNKHWSLKQQSLIDQNGIKVDKLDIELLSGEEVTYYFDISRSFGKFEIDKTSPTLMTEKELLEFAIKMVLEHSDELNEDTVIDISSENSPHIYANIDNMVSGIIVKTSMYPNHPTLSQNERIQFEEQSKQKVFEPYFAPVSFYWKDGKTEEENGMPVKNGAFHVNFKGLEKL